MLVDIHLSISRTASHNPTDAGCTLSSAETKISRSEIMINIKHIIVENVSFAHLYK